jgi:Kazal-type serine protease inhibitor domain
MLKRLGDGIMQREEKQMRSLKLALALAFTLLLSSCVVVEEGTEPPRGPQIEQPRLCPQNYDPVCGARGGERLTFPNACEANSSSFRVLYRGECRRGATPPPQSGPQTCPAFVDPVCARRGNIERSFPNDCQAEASGFQPIYRGECRRTEPDAPGFAGPGNGGCPRILEPVCGSRGGQLRSFNNSCEAEADGFEVLKEGRCRG